MYLSGKTMGFKIGTVPYPVIDADLDVDAAFVDMTNALSGGYQDGISAIIRGKLQINAAFDPTLAQVAAGASCSITFILGGTYEVTATALANGLKFTNGMTKGAMTSQTFNFVGTWSPTFVAVP